MLKSVLRTEVTYDDEMKNKYVVKKEWDKSKRKALILMKSAGLADEIVQDQTTMYVMNNLAKLDYGSVVIMNLFTSIEEKDTNEPSTENLKCVLEEVTKVDDIIIAVGTGIETNKEALKRLHMIVAILLDKKANILQIECPKGRKGFHPLYPAVYRTQNYLAIESLHLDELAQFGYWISSNHHFYPPIDLNVSIIIGNRFTSLFDSYDSYFWGKLEQELRVKNE